MFSGKELQKDEKEIFTGLKLCRHIPFPFWFYKLKKKIASPPIRNVARYTSGYKVTVYMYMHIYIYIYIYMYIRFHPFYRLRRPLGWVEV